MTPLRRRAPIAALLVALALLAAACGSSSSDSGNATATTAAGGKDFKWVMVTDQAGLGDQGFNDLAYAGITKSAKDLGGTGKAIESSEQAQYVPNLQQAVDDGASLVVGVGFLITDAIVEVAQASTDAHFLSIDNVAADKAGTPLPNVASVTFKENEGAYLAGIIAGMTTKTNKIGFAGGLEIPPVVRFLKGFEAGLKSVNPKATVNVAYAGGFGDAAKVKALAAGYYDGGADIVFEVAGAGGLGAYEEAKSRGAGHWVIGTDTCKDALAPDNFLTSATKDVSGAVEREAKAVADGTFKGGVHNLGLAEDSVGVCQKTFGTLDKSIQDAVTKATADIKSGAITVPAT
ncbi:MAG: family transporter substrate-binding protein [Actinomycetia bacterium]|nr:family transporter substrate-binding protein [Actinomycetes bacterium]